MKRRSEIKQILTKTSASGETDKERKDREETNVGAGNIHTPTPNKGEKVREKTQET